MKKKSTLPKNVRLKDGSYYYVYRKPHQKNQTWQRLCSAKGGEVDLQNALLLLESQEISNIKTMAALLDDYYLNEFQVKNLNGDFEANRKKQANVLSMIRRVKRTIGESSVSKITTQFMSDFFTHEFSPSTVRGLTLPQRQKAKSLDQANSHNKYRAFLKVVFAYAEKLGLRPGNSNPILSIERLKETVKKRPFTDSELRRIKQALLRGDDGKRSTIGKMMCLLMDMALLTGQRAKDLRRLEWSDITDQGIQFLPSKTAASTGERILIEWTPKLREVVSQLRTFPKHHIRYVFVNIKTQPLKAGDITNAWKRAMDRCIRRGTLSAEDRPKFRDLRRKAITEVVANPNRGWVEGKAMGAHASIEQTEDYVGSPTIFITKRTRASR